MKKILPLLYIVSLAFVQSCKKDCGEPNLAINGKWELIRNSGEVTQGRIVTYSSGNGNIIDFTGSNYTIYVNGTLFKTGTYKLIKDVSPGGTSRNLIVYDDEVTSAQIVTLRNSILTIEFDAPDPETREYVRIK